MINNTNNKKQSNRLDNIIIVIITSVLTSIVMVSLFIFFVVVLMGFGVYGKLVTYHDVNIYKDSLYTQFSYIDIKDEDTYFKKATEESNKFFPKYEDIDYKYSSLDFYIYDGSGYYTEAITYTLDIYFDDINIYNEEKKEIINKYNNCIGQIKITKGSYECLSIDDESCSNFRKSCSILCLNDNSLCIRMVYYQSVSIGDYIDDMLSCTSCSWE